MAEYRNPQQEPGGDKRMLMVFAVAFALIILFQTFLFKKPPAQPNKPADNKTAQTSQTPAQSPAQDQPASESVATPAAAAATANTPAKAADSEVQTIVENALYRVTFTNKGGLVKSWILKKYKDENGNPLDLVNKQAAEKFGYPLSLYSYDPSLSEQINNALYVPNTTGSMQAPGELSFEYAANGVSVRKSFIFGSEYVISVETQVTKDGKLLPAFPAWPAGLGDETTAPAFASERVEYLGVGERNPERLAAKKVSGGNTIRGPFYWAGSQDQFFAAIFLPENPDAAAMVTLRNTLVLPKDPKKPDPNDIVKYEVLGAAVGNPSSVTRARLFVGPKALNILESVRSNTAPGQMNGPDLRNVVDFGFFSIIARPLFLWLKWTHEHIASNWGVCILILTVCINLALLPLRITSTKSALKMQKLQPQMKAIQEKYKKLPMRDPKRQEMNAEIGDLYKREGVNPAGGCLPLVIQMPFLFAFYTMLQNAIELRQAPFLWLHDLSAPDKLFVMPVLIVVSTYLMQKMTPNAGMDPKQQQLMTLMMPLMIGWFSFNLPSGLSVYWIVGNIILMIQQYVINKSHLGQELRAEQEKRARKKAGK